MESVATSRATPGKAYLAKLEEISCHATESLMKCCDEILDSCRRELVLKSPTDQSYKEHKVAVRALLKYGGMINFFLSDPESGNPSLAAAMKIRLDQLHEAWLSFFADDRMTEKEADEFLAGVFPE